MNECLGEFWYLMLDSTIVRGHHQAATGRKKGARTRLWGVPEEV